MRKTGEKQEAKLIVARISAIDGQLSAAHERY